MERHFDEELNELRAYILKISTLALDAISGSIEALGNLDKKQARKIIDADTKIDDLDLIIDEKCIDLLALYQPMAADLRFITTGLKLNSELERIGDLAVDIAQRVLEIADKPMLKPLVDIPKLTEVAIEMVRMAIDSFMKKDVALAKKVIHTDSKADDYKNKISAELINDYMSKDPATADRAVSLLLVSRHLERICDHACNIAEDVVYMVKGKVIKHHHENNG